MNSYHFDLGNSTDGPIGMCARILAHTKREALEVMKEVLPEWIEVTTGDPRVEYIHVYIGEENITTADIDEWEETK